MKKFHALSLSDVVFIMLINVKVPTIDGILTFMSRINFVISCVEHGKSFITFYKFYSLCGFPQSETQNKKINFTCSKIRYNTFPKANTKGTDQTVWMLGLVCPFVNRKP